MEEIQSVLEEALYGKGASLIGYADLRELPAKVTHSLPFAISIAFALFAAYPGFNQFTYQIGNGQLLAYPAAGFALLGLVLIYRAHRNSFDSHKV